MIIMSGYMPEVIFMNGCKDCQRLYDGGCPYEDGDYCIVCPQACGQECSYFKRMVKDEGRLDSTKDLDEAS